MGIGYICVKFECTIYVRLSPQLRVMLWEKLTAGITVPERQLGCGRTHRVVAGGVSAGVHTMRPTAALVQSSCRRCAAPAAL